MALKSKEWFYKHCLQELQNYSPLAHLSWDILQKGVGGKDQTRGHVTQAIGAVQLFFQKYPQHLSAIRSAEPTRPFDVPAYTTILKDWQAWMKTNKSKSSFGRKSFGYNHATLRTYLTKKLGGNVSDGGGGNDEFKRVIRLLAAFYED